MTPDETRKMEFKSENHYCVAVDSLACSVKTINGPYKYEFCRRLVAKIDKLLKEKNLDSRYYAQMVMGQNGSPQWWLDFKAKDGFSIPVWKKPKTKVEKKGPEKKIEPEPFDHLAFLRRLHSIK